MIAHALRRRPRHAWRTALLLCLCALLPPLHAQDALRLAGVNLSGAEIAPSKIPGVVGIDYTYPRSSDYVRSVRVHRESAIAMHIAFL